MLRRRLRALALLASAIAAPLGAPPLAAQGVLVAPPGIVIDHRTRSGAVELYNPGTEPAEVSIATIFGFPVTDSAGRTTVRFFERPEPGQPSAAAWIEAYPKRLTLRPQDRQTVRLLGRPPAGLADGEYWTRLIVTAKGARLPAATAGADTAISVGLAVEVRTVVAVLYRKGPMSTGVRLSSARASVAGDSAVLRVRLERQGNAAFIGTLRATLVDARGATVGQSSLPVAVYYDLEPRLPVPAPRTLAPGRYTLRFELNTEREDLTKAVVLPVATMRDSVAVTLPSGR